MIGAAEANKVRPVSSKVDFDLLLIARAGDFAMALGPKVRWRTELPSWNTLRPRSAALKPLVKPGVSVGTVVGA